MTTTEKAPEEQTASPVANTERKAYRATIEGDRIRWLDEPPEREGPWEVVVETTGDHQDGDGTQQENDSLRRDLTLEDIANETPEEKEARTEAILEAFRKLQASNPFADIEDPVAWQREIRKDRPLPGREE